MGWIDAVLDNRITGWSAAVLLAALLLILLFTDRLVTRGAHLRELAAVTKRAEDFKELYEVADKRAEIQADALGVVVTLGETMDKFIKSLPQPKTEGSIT